MEKNAAGKFIVLDGIDGCGKGTQTKLLSDFLIQKGYNLIVKKYPEYGQPIGDLIDAWLHKKFEMNIYAESLVYFADFIKDKNLFENFLKNGNIIVADRYFTATIVYQNLKGFHLNKLLDLAKLFELPKPDLCLYLKISPETSLQRKSEQKGVQDLDRHEENLQFQKLLAETFDKMASEKIFCDWEIIDGEQSAENVHNQIIGILNKKYYL